MVYESSSVDSIEPTTPATRRDHDHRGQLAAAQHVVADADLIGGQVLPHPLVDSFVASAYQYQVVVTRELLDYRLGQPSALGGHQHDGDAVVQSGRGAYRLHGLEYRSGLHEHAWATAEGVVVHRAMAVVGLIADVVGPDVQHTRPPGSGDYALVEGAGEHAGEKRQDVESHTLSVPCTGVTTPTATYHHPGHSAGVVSSLARYCCGGPAVTLSHAKGLGWLWCLHMYPAVRCRRLAQDPTPDSSPRAQNDIAWAAALLGAAT